MADQQKTQAGNQASEKDSADLATTIVFTAEAEVIPGGEA